MESKSILVISPHPDDETLGAGGTLLRYKSEGNSIFWLNISNMKEEYGYEKKTVLKRNNEIEKVNQMYNFDGAYNLELKPAELDTYSIKEFTEKVSRVINEVKPRTIILPYKYDVHSDHGIVFDVVYACTKSFRYPFVKKILSMEILSETDFAYGDNGFIPNYFIDISRFLKKKIEIMQIYKSELGEHPFPRSIQGIESLAISRGQIAGVKYAEAFKLIKEIE